MVKLHPILCKLLRELYQISLKKLKQYGCWSLDHEDHVWWAYVSQSRTK